MYTNAQRNMLLLFQFQIHTTHSKLIPRLHGNGRRQFKQSLFNTSSIRNTLLSNNNSLTLHTHNNTNNKLYQTTTKSNNIKIYQVSQTNRTILTPSNILCQRRFYSTNDNKKTDKTNDIKSRNLSVSLWVSAILVAAFGGAYLAIPLYRMFCRATGYGGTVKVEDEKSKKGQLILDKDGKPKEFRQIKVHLNSIVGDNLEWSFKPMQTPVYAIPNEPVLVFYEATNQSDTPVIGVATYNVVPQQAGLYFVKIQCFCFDEQRLKPHETVPMPVLFYIDPKITEDETLRDIDTLTLSYTFYRSDDQNEPK